MKTLKQHLDMVMVAMNDASARRNEGLAIDVTNVCMGEIASSFPIGVLTDTIAVTSGADAYLPPNLAGIISVRRSDTGVLVWPRDQAGARADENIPRYFTSLVPAAESDSDLPFLSTGSISAGGSTITCPALYVLSETVDLVGMTIVVNNEQYGNYFYTIESVNDDDQTIGITGNHPYEETNADIRVRPAELSQKFTVVDSAEAEIDNVEFNVCYWKTPNPLSLPTDIIPMAYPTLLELMTIRRLPNTKDRRPVSKSELDDAQRVARVREPKIGVSQKPVDESGQKFTFSPSYNGRQPYVNRGQ